MTIPKHGHSQKTNKQKTKSEYQKDNSKHIHPKHKSILTLTILLKILFSLTIGKHNFKINFITN
jgi:hypothetical protein